MMKDKGKENSRQSSVGSCQSTVDSREQSLGASA